jgi:hypothetical protein
LTRRTARTFGSRFPWTDPNSLPRIDRAVLLLTACLSASCLGGSPARPGEASPAAIEQLESLAAFTGGLQEISTDEREQYYRELLVQLDAEPPTVDRALRIALLLGDPRAPYYAPGEALMQLENVSGADTRDDSGQATLVRVFHHLLSAYEEVNEHHRHEIEALRAELLTEQIRRLDFEEQLNALKAVEQQIAIDDAVTP